MDHHILTIDSITGKGDGIAQLDGQPVYIPRAASGDKLRVEVTTVKDNAHGRIIEMIEAGPDRVEAPCPHYAICGGCQMQHLSVAAYQAWKENSVKELFIKAGVVPQKWQPTVFISEATRRRVTFAAFKRGQELTLGFNGSRSDQIANQEICLLLTPALNDLRNRMRPYLLKILPEGKLIDVSLQDVDGAIELILTGDFSDISTARSQAVTDAVHGLGLARIGWRATQFAEPEIWLQLSPVTKSFAKMVVTVPPASFLQPSREGEAALVAAVQAGCKGMKKARFLDLFSGCGTFSGHLLAQGEVHAVETDRPAVTALKNAIPYSRGLSVERRDLFKEPVTSRELNMYDCVVFDPPRAGAKAQAEIMAKAKTAKIIGVSCNPTSFITDAKILMAGGYKLTSLQIVDQFIWSTHSEVVGVFSR